MKLRLITMVNGGYPKMRISEDAKELARLKYIEKAQQIADSHDLSIRNIRRATVIGPDLQTAIDRQYLAKARDIAEAWADLQLEAFMDEGLLPDKAELSKMGREIEKIIQTHIPTEAQGHTVLPVIMEAFNKLPYDIYNKLKRRIRRIELEQKTKQKRDQKIQKAVQEETNATSSSDFSFIADTRMKAIIERDYAELQQLDPEKTSKSVLILSGSIIEGLLIDALIKSGDDEKETFEKQLKQLIHPAKAKGIIAQDSVGEWLRIFRNLVHPAKEIREGLPLTKNHAKHARTSVDVIITEIRKWYETIVCESVVEKTDKG